MKNQSKEEGTRDTESKGKGPKEAFYWPEAMPEMVAKCCEGMAGHGPANVPAVMERCCEPMMRACRWFPLLPVVLAGAAFLLGYYLNPATVRVLWLVVSGTVVLTACLGLILANVMCRARARRRGFLGRRSSTAPA